MNKFCQRCDKTKPVSQFYKNIVKKDGLQGYCKDCMQKENQINYKKRHII